MELEIRTLQIGKGSWVQSVTKDYQKKISFFQKIEIKQIKNESDFLKSIDDKDFVVICDERGKGFSSKEFSETLNKILESGKQRCFLIIGGPFGLPEEVKSRANLFFRLSNLVFNQEVALLVLMEQIFRALTIINNHPYHND